jgi:ubiquinone/menaquinone biosynthesis C-methylase UbiE
LGQRFFFSAVGARAYPAVRESPATWLVTGRTFSEERQWLLHALAPPPDAVVLDVPCGQGNFTAAIARTLPDGAVIGVDLSERQLALAARRVEREQLDQVLLLRASALQLPLADDSVAGLSSCGGLHLYPDVPLAITEMARVLTPGRAAAGLTFVAHRGGWGRLARAAARALGIRAFDFDELGAGFAAAGFEGWRYSGRGLVAWFAARST